MSHRCHHGTLIQDSWMNCAECCEEHDAREAAYAAEEAASEARKQTAILERMASNAEERRSTASSAPARNTVTESLELARQAEERNRLNDLSGAIQLITQALDVQPDFAPFRIQRARYRARLGKSGEALDDLRSAFSINQDVLFEMEWRLERELDPDFAPIESEIDDLVCHFRGVAAQQMSGAQAQACTAVEALRAELSLPPFPDFVQEVLTRFEQLADSTSMHTCADFAAAQKAAASLASLTEIALERVARIRGDIASAVETASKRVGVLDTLMAEVCGDAAKAARERYAIAIAKRDARCWPELETSLAAAKEAWSLAGQAFVDGHMMLEVRSNTLGRELHELEKTLRGGTEKSVTSDEYRTLSEQVRKTRERLEKPETTTGFPGVVTLGLVIGWFVALFNRAGIKWLIFALAVRFGIPIIGAISRSTARSSDERWVEAQEKELQRMRQEDAARAAKAQATVDADPRVVVLRKEMAKIRSQMDRLKAVA